MMNRSEQSFPESEYYVLPDDAGVPIGAVLDAGESEPELEWLRR